MRFKWVQKNPISSGKMNGTCVVIVQCIKFTNILLAISYIELAMESFSSTGAYFDATFKILPEGVRSWDRRQNVCNGLL